MILSLLSLQVVRHIPRRIGPKHQSLIIPKGFSLNFLSDGVVKKAHITSGSKPTQKQLNKESNHQTSPCVTLFEKFSVQTQTLTSDYTCVFKMMWQQLLPPGSMLASTVLISGKVLRLEGQEAAPR